jgi:predicted Co/Zn/Cd cation transporter (cation efflux family)
VRQNQTDRLRRRQKSSVLTGLQIFQSVLMLLQLYLFISVLESILAGKTSTAIPAAVFSIVILVVNIWMLIGVRKLERQL